MCIRDRNNIDDNSKEPIFRKSLNIKAGINRFVWPFELERTEDEFFRYRDNLIKIKKEFKGVVIDKKGLDKYNFIDQKSFTDLNKVRKSFLDDYGMYAGGVKVFDYKLYDNFEADEGIYNVEIRLNNGKKFTDKIIVREDPLKSN